jgi:hypothetical protein
VLLENLEVKKSLFDSYPFPISLHYGKVGRIFLQIPFMKIFSQPLKIEISDVFMIVKPKVMEDWKEEVEIAAFKKGVQA